jgi:hypothetical protein
MAIRIDRNKPANRWREQMRRLDNQTCVLLRTCDAQSRKSAHLLRTRQALDLPEG